MRRLSPAISQRIAMGILWLLTLATIAVLFYIIFYFFHESFYLHGW